MGHEPERRQLRSPAETPPTSTTMESWNHLDPRRRRRTVSAMPMKKLARDRSIQTRPSFSPRQRCRSPSCNAKANFKSFGKGPPSRSSGFCAGHRREKFDPTGKPVISGTWPEWARHSVWDAKGKSKGTLRYPPRSRFKPTIKNLMTKKNRSSRGGPVGYAIKAERARFGNTWLDEGFHHDFR